MLKGIDLHSGKWVNNWQNIKNAGIQVVINKATEGTYYKDKYLSYRREQCKKLGIHFGVYHFAGHQNAVDEVNTFINYTKGIESDTISWLDIEDVPSYSWRKWSKSDAVNFVNKFDSLFRSKTGKDIGVYCSQSFYEDYLKGNIRSDMKLWIAHYGINNIPYSTQSWQYTDKGTIAGEKEAFDMDLFAEDILIQKSTKPLASKTVVKTSKYDESIPEGDNILKVPGGYIEGTADGRMILHRDRGNYISIGKGFTDIYWNDNNGNSGSKRISG
jgi:lysozyme